MVAIVECFPHFSSTSRNQSRTFNSIIYPYSLQLPDTVVPSSPLSAYPGGAAEAVERGAVFVYKRGAAEGLVLHRHLRASPPSPQARFGAAIAVIGDIDRDGFQGAWGMRVCWGVGAVFTRGYEFRHLSLAEVI